MKRTRRKITELLADNNGWTVGAAVLEDGLWYCVAYVYINGNCNTLENATCLTRKATETWLREIAEATKIIPCPEV